MNKIILYAHGGSKNHGCEALVRSAIKVLNLQKQQIDLFSMQVDEDYKYGLDSICTIKEHERSPKRISLERIILFLNHYLIKNTGIYLNSLYKELFKSFNANTVALSIGGDNYCYEGLIERLIFINKAAKARGAKIVLWGCSIEPELLKDKKIIEDLKSYSLIYARESITYNELINAGITANTKLFPDAAFMLDKVCLPLPEGFTENNTIGINVSPLIQDYENSDGSTMKNYIALLKYIIDNTDMQIALIPHVVWDNNNDLLPLQRLYEVYMDTNRVILLGDYNCMEIKGFISRCRMFIGARTHATIAAYSTCVPTLVVGYSVKAKGIAKDIFGTYENYVIPVQTLTNEDDLVNAFCWLSDNEEGIRAHLKEFIPSYRNRVLEAENEVKKLFI